MKYFFFIILIFVFNTSDSAIKDSKLKDKLNTLKKQTVKIHNEILRNNKELDQIKLDIDKNTQQKIIFNKYIKNREILGGRLVFLLQEKFYTNQLTRIVKNLNTSSDNLVTKQVIRGFFLKQVKTGISEYFESLENLKDLELELAVKLRNYREKKKVLQKKLDKLEKKIKEVAYFQRKVKQDKKLKIKEKKLKKKAKNLNELIKGTETKRKIISKITSKFTMPVFGEIISDFGEGKDLHKLKNGLVFRVKEDSFVTSPMNGIVVYANRFKRLGNLVMIQDANGFTSVLIGMKNLLISTGNEVLMGEPIAKITSSMKSQLYFELRKNGQIVDPKSKVEIL
ncbi:MAG: peptidoglycan DD-metalloendopeptidase family protein [Pseudomonadota bacterium]|nr:peptidoglycan DD-metalloendopeptidase family protein [Pseudomonadota bacterium]